jgi:hypothetical protein
MVKKGLLLLCTLAVISCADKQEAGPDNAAARVNNSYLDREELRGIVPQEQVKRTA